MVPPGAKRFSAHCDSSPGPQGLPQDIPGSVGSNQRMEKERGKEIKRWEPSGAYPREAAFLHVQSIPNKKC